MMSILKSFVVILNMKKTNLLYQKDVHLMKIYTFGES